MRISAFALALFSGCSQAPSQPATPPVARLHAERPAVQAHVSAPIATPASTPNGQAALAALMPWSGTASAPHFARLMWRKSFISPQSGRGAQILAAGPNLILAVNDTIIALREDSSRFWIRFHAGQPFEVGGDTIFVTSGNRLEALNSGSGSLRWSSRPCGNKPPNFVVVGVKNVAAGCDGLGRAESDIVALDRRNGRRSYVVPYARMGYSNYRVERASEDFVWIQGGFSGAYSGEQATLVNLSTGKVLSQHIDVEFSGRIGSRLYLNDRGTMPGSRLDVYEPVRLSWVDLTSSVETKPAVYAPDPQRWPGHEEDSEYAVGSAHVLGDVVYVTAGKNLYRYSLRAPPEAQRPQLLVENLAEPPVYVGSRAVLRRLNPDSGTALRVIPAPPPPPGAPRGKADISIRHWGSSVVGIADLSSRLPVATALFSADANTSSPGYGAASEIDKIREDLAYAPDNAGNLRVMTPRGVLTAIPVNLVPCRCLLSLERIGSMLFVLFQTPAPNYGSRYQLLALHV